MISTRYMVQQFFLIIIDMVYFIHLNIKYKSNLKKKKMFYRIEYISDMFND